MIMSELTDKIIQAAEQKNVKFNAREIERTLKDKDGNEVSHKQVDLQTALQVDQNKVVPCAVVLHDNEDLEYINYQMNYNRIGLVTDRNELPNILEKINELNGMKSGYYHIVVNPDRKSVV